MRELPLNARDFYQLMLLLVGLIFIVGIYPLTICLTSTTFPVRVASFRDVTELLIVFVDRR